METIEKGIIRIVVKNLAISPLQARKKQGASIEELAALIAAQGLIHNLVVNEQTKKGKKTGKYEVAAGGRRLAALQLLRADGRLPKTMKSIAACRPRRSPKNKPGREQ